MTRNQKNTSKQRGKNVSKSSKNDYKKLVESMQSKTWRTGIYWRRKVVHHLGELEE
jgi:hypothetical protein